MDFIRTNDIRKYYVFFFYQNRYSGNYKTDMNTEKTLNTRLLIILLLLYIMRTFNFRVLKLFHIPLNVNRKLL